MASEPEWQPKLVDSSLTVVEQKAVKALAPNRGLRLSPSKQQLS
jgi:hypothetical protein